MSKLWTPDGRLLEAPGLHLVWGRGQVINPDGSVAWEEDWQPNTLFDEGEESVLNVYFREQTNPTKFLALLTGAQPAETATMATMTELFAPPLNGYSRQALTAADWGAPALNAGDFQTTHVEETFGPASGSAWSSFTRVAMVTTSTGTAGKLILVVALSGTTSIAIGQSFKYTITTKAQ